MASAKAVKERNQLASQNLRLLEKVEGCNQDHEQNKDESVRKSPLCAGVQEVSG